jgi:hypothetical protein
MKFLLEYSQYNDDINSFHLSEELIDEIKEVLTDYLSDVVEEELPEIKEGFIKHYINEGRIYAFKYAPDDEDTTGINCIFVSKQKYNLPLERLSFLVSNIDENLTCIKGYNADIIITHKKLIQKIEAYYRFVDALENAVGIIESDEGKWSKWAGALSIQMDNVKSKEVSIQLWKFGHLPNSIEVKPSYPRLNINFYMPTIEYNDDDIIWDVYFTIIQPTPEKQRGRFSDTKSEEYKKDLKEFEDFAKKLEKSTNEVFMYHITNSVETITDEILTWLEGEVFPFFENDETKKYDNLLKTLNNLDESGIQIELTSEPEIGRFFEVVVKWRNKESIMNLIYIHQTNKVRIIDEFDKQLEECDLEELGENLFLIMSEM